MTMTTRKQAARRGSAAQAIWAALPMAASHAISIFQVERMTGVAASTIASYLCFWRRQGWVQSANSPQARHLLLWSRSDLTCPGTYDAAKYVRRRNRGTASR